jgi:hypothetical protein
MQITVRKADPSDLDWILAQLPVFDRFYGAKHSLLGEETYVRGFIAGLIEKHLVLVADSDTAGLIGFIAGLLSPHPYNPALTTLYEQFWWVAEEHRGTRAGLMLLNAYTAWGKANAHWTTMTLEDKSPIADRTLLKRGFKLKERQYILEAN